MHTFPTAVMTALEPVRPSCGMPPPWPSSSTQRMRPSRPPAQPGDGDLGLAAGEAADAGDVGARLDDRRGRALLAGDADGPAAVGLGVGERLGERGGVAAEQRRRRPGRPAPCRRARRRPVPPAGRACAPPPGPPRAGAARAAEAAGARAGRRRGTCRWWRGRASAPTRSPGAASRPASADAERDHADPLRRSATVAATATMPVTTSSSPSRARQRCC